MSRNLTKIIFTLLIVLFAIFSFTGSVAAENETTQVSPILFLTFDTIPADLISGAEVTLNTSSNISESTLKMLKNMEGVSGMNIAYMVDITSKGLNTSTINQTRIQLPVAKSWTENKSNIGVITITNQTVKHYNASLIESVDDKQQVFQANLTSLPDKVFLVSITKTIIAETPVSTPTQVIDSPTPTITSTPASPAPLMWIAGCLVIGILFANRRKE